MRKFRILGIRLGTTAFHVLNNFTLAYFRSIAIIDLQSALSALLRRTLKRTDYASP
jgi:hypothetical protein